MAAGNCKGSNQSQPIKHQHKAPSIITGIFLSDINNYTLSLTNKTGVCVWGGGGGGGEKTRERRKR